MRGKDRLLQKHADCLVLHLGSPHLITFVVSAAPTGILTSGHPVRCQNNITCEGQMSPSCHQSSEKDILSLV